jgi:hypothetical protein
MFTFGMFVRLKIWSVVFNYVFLCVGPKVVWYKSEYIPRDWDPNLNERRAPNSSALAYYRDDDHELKCTCSRSRIHVVPH